MTLGADSMPAILRFLPEDVTAIGVVGEGVPALSSAVARRYGLTIDAEAHRFAALSRNGSLSGGRLRDLPPAGLDAVLLRRAWPDRRDVGFSLAAARAAVTGGGVVLAAELDAAALLEGPDWRHASRVLYRAVPRLRDRLRAATISPSALSIEMVRAGLREVAVAHFDELIGTHPSASEYWRAMRSGGWRGQGWLDEGERDRFFESAADAVARAFPTGEIEDREPWFVVIGTKP